MHTPLVHTAFALPPLVYALLAHTRLMHGPLSMSLVLPVSHMFYVTHCLRQARRQASLLIAAHTLHNELAAMALQVTAWNQASAASL